MALNEWVPKLIVNLPDEQSGDVIKSTRWRELWALIIEQGDDNAQTIKDILDELFSTAWHPTAGAATINTPAIYEDGETTVAGQLAELLSHMDAAEAAILVETGRVDDLLDGTLAAYDADRLGGELPAVYALASQITNLQGQIDAISAGEIAAFDHNDISTRDAEDAHPISAITGLTAALAAIEALDTDDIAFGAGTLTTKISNIDATIAALSGDMTEIAHNDLATRDAANAHPTSAITGLDTALAGKEATVNLTANRALISSATGTLAVSAVTATELGYVDGVTSAIQTQLNAKQKSITSGTANPSGGVNGDIYIKYA